MSCSSTTQSPTFISIYQAQSQPPPTSSSLKWRSAVTMKGRANNPRPLQKGRTLSIEAIQAVQALKRSQSHILRLERAFDSQFRRLLKLDMIAVLRELLRQDECFLALKVFEDVRREYWYKPQIPLYADMIGVFGRNGMMEQVEIVCSYFKSETNLKPEIKEFNALFAALIGLGLGNSAVDCYSVMKRIGCDPDRSSFRILINGLESIGEIGFSGSLKLRLEAQEFYGESLDFLEEDEDLALTS